MSELDYSAAHEHVLLTGSLVEGFGNSLSDIDVLIVGGARACPTSVYYSSSAKRWIDVCHLPESELIRCLAALPSPSGDCSDWSSARTAPFSVLDQLHDVCHGVSLTKPWEGQVLPRDRGLAEALSKSWAMSNLISARARWQDAVGASLDGQSLQASYVRGMCVGLCIDGYTALFGETDINVKWRFAKLARVHARGLDCLGLFERWMALKNLEFFGWSESAQLLFDVICLATSGALYTLDADVQEGERVEVDKGRWVRVRVDGTAEPIAAPRRLRSVGFGEVAE
ncbi:MAG: hypothetical protein ACK4OE_08530 [Acidovorax sp.]|uniref:hypothetical protein n=1 Tax=Acidovorax sp. TaxID=1872122 RepID=UPI00391953DE